MTVSRAVKDAALALFAGQTLAVGLFDGESEISDPGYARQVTGFSEPKGIPDDDLRFVENVSELRYPAVSRDHHVDHYGLFDAVGDLLAVFKLLTALDPLVADDNAVFQAGSLRVGVL